MNKMQEIFNCLSDPDLKSVVRDLKEQRETGILPSGAARDLMHRLVEEIGMPFNVAYDSVQREALLIAAIKWAST